MTTTTPELLSLTHSPPGSFPHQLRYQLVRPSGHVNRSQSTRLGSERPQVPSPESTAFIGAPNFLRMAGAPEEDVNFLKFGTLSDGDHLSNATVATLLQSIRTQSLEEAPHQRMPECVFQLETLSSNIIRLL